jgi:predicted AlkP superfamily pyrophosphatase or phosphodiesterase
MTTAQVDWVAIHNAKTITLAFPERPSLTDTIVREMIAAGAVTEAGIQNFAKESIVWRDEIWTLAGQHIIEKHRPHVLLFHLLTTDSAQHRYGANSLAGSAALALADTKVQRLVDSLARAGLRERTAMFIVSDHGFKTYRQVIHPNALLRQKGLLRDSGGKISCDAWGIPEGGTAMVYITRAERREDLLPSLRAMFSTLPGVAQVIEAPTFAKFGYPAQPGGQMADLVLAAADGYAFDGAHQGEPVTNVPAGATPGAHGYLSADTAMDAVFIGSGVGIKPGARLGRIRNVDLAPTAARLLGLDMKGMQGRVLTEILM